MTQIMEVVTSFLDQNGWDFTRLDDDVVQTEAESPRGTWPVVVQVRTDEEQVLCYSLLPAPVPLEDRGAFAELLAHINFGLPIGTFELDMNDGEIRCRTSIGFEGTELTPPLWEQVLLANVFTMDAYFELLVDVATGQRSTADAIAEVA